MEEKEFGAKVEKIVGTNDKDTNSNAIGKKVKDMFHDENDKKSKGMKYKINNIPTNINKPTNNLRQKNPIQDIKIQKGISMNEEEKLTKEDIKTKIDRIENLMNKLNNNNIPNDEIAKNEGFGDINEYNRLIKLKNNINSKIKNAQYVFSIYNKEFTNEMSIDLQKVYIYLYVLGYIK